MSDEMLGRVILTAKYTKPNINSALKLAPKKAYYAYTKVMNPIFVYNPRRVAQHLTLTLSP